MEFLRNVLRLTDGVEHPVKTVCTCLSKFSMMMKKIAYFNIDKFLNQIFLYLSTDSLKKLRTLKFFDLNFSYMFDPWSKKKIKIIFSLVSKFEEAISTKKFRT